MNSLNGHHLAVAFGGVLWLENKGAEVVNVCRAVRVAWNAKVPAIPPSQQLPGEAPSLLESTMP